MGPAEYLIDTNIVIDYLGGKIPGPGVVFVNSVIDDIPKVSIVTKIEVLSFNASNEDYTLLTSFMNDSKIIGLTDNIIETTIDIRKSFKTKLPDAIIAATAIFSKMILLTRNTTDFKNITGLKILNPYEFINSQRT